MNDILKSITTREFASCIWLGAFVIALLFYKPARDGMGPVIRTFFKPIIIVPLLIAALYATGEILLLNWIGWWSVANLKTTVLWVVTFGFVTMFELATAKSRKAGLGKITRDIVTVTAFLLFITQLYSFPLVVELFALPVVTFVALLTQMSAFKPEHASASKVLGCLSGLIGFTYFGYSLWKSIELWRETLTWANGLELLIPILLSFGFLPFLYAWRAYVAYNETFINISIFGIDEALVPYARWLAATRIRGDLDLLERWRKSIQSTRPANKAELKHTLTALLALREREASPPAVPLKDGWSPYLAMQFLTGMSVDTGHYNHRYEDEWGASSLMREFGPDGIWRNNIAYYIDGTEHAATVLKIKLNVNVPAEGDEADEIFILQTMHLLEQAISFDAVERLKMQIASLETFDADIPFGFVSLTYEEMGGALKGGYSRIFTIRRGA